MPAGATWSLPVPVTAKLSRRFSETFGDDLTNELVDLLNQVDATYRSELREMNDLNYARFEAKLDQRTAEVRAELIKWMFLFWIGTVVPLAGLIVALHRL